MNDELEQELDIVLNKVQAILSKNEMNILRYACGKPEKHYAVEHLNNLFNDFSNIFRSNK